MNQSCPKDEQTWMNSLLTFRLPPVYRKIGLCSALTIMLVLILYKIYGANTILFKDVLRTVMLFFMLMATLSKDRLEDEYNLHIRHQSFVVAFVAATAYTILIPMIAFAFDFAISGITGDGVVSFYELSAFEVVFTLLGIQLLAFETLKRLACAQ